MTVLAADPVSAAVPPLADAIDKTLQWLDLQGCSEPDQERRHTQRSRYRVTATITHAGVSTNDQITVQVKTRNLSRTGLSFIHTNFLYPGQHLDLQLPLPDQSLLQAKAHVIRVRATRNLYEIGIEFTSPS